MASRPRCNLFNECCKILCRSNWCCGSARHNRSRDLIRLWLFTIFAKQSSKFMNVQVCKERRRRLTLRRIKSKIECAASANSKAALAINELIRREAKIKEDSVAARKSCSRRRFGDARVAPLEGVEAITEWCESHTRACNRRWVCVNTKELTVRRTRRQYRLCVAAAAEICIDVVPAGANCKSIKRFAQQDWLVKRRLMRSTARLQH